LRKALVEMRESAWSINGLTLGLLKYCSERGWERLAEWGHEQQAELWLERMWKQIEKIEHMISTSFRTDITFDTLEDIKYANADHLKVFEVDGSTYSTAHEAALAFAEYAVYGLTRIECDGDDRERCGCVVDVAEGLQKSVPDLFAEIEMECIRSLRYYDERESLLADQTPEIATESEIDAPATEGQQADQSGKITAKDGRTPEERDVEIHDELIKLYKEGKKPIARKVANVIGSSLDAVKRSDMWLNREVIKNSISMPNGPTARGSGQSVEYLAACDEFNSKVAGFELDPVKNELKALGYDDLEPLVDRFCRVDPTIREAAYDTIKKNLKSDPAIAARVLVDAAETVT
jgi:hypothetical protein